MSLRFTSGAALTAAVLAVALPAAASARTDDQVAGGYGQPADPATLMPTGPTTTTTHDAGVGTVTVLVLAGGTLLLGAAGGVGGTRFVARRGPAAQA